MICTSNVVFSRIARNRVWRMRLAMSLAVDSSRTFPSCDNRDGMPITATRPITARTTNTSKSENPDEPVCRHRPGR